MEALLPLLRVAGDLLICAGDVELRNTRDWQYFLAFLNRQPHSNKIVSFGNMDSWTEDHGSAPSRTLQQSYRQA